jgi:LTXXQ motif family protein
MRRVLTFVGTVTILAQLVLEPAFAKDRNNTSPTTVLLPGTITGVGSHGPTGY